MGSSRTTRMTTTMMMPMTTTTMTSLIILLSTLSLGIDCALTIKPTLDRTSVNYTVVEGRKAILPCTVHDLGTHKVVWIDQWNTVLTFNEATVIDDPRISVTRPHEEEWNLQFEKVKYGDQGVYVCQVNTTPALQQSVMLTVVVPPAITSEIPGDMVMVKEGETATLTCNATGIPRPSVTWYRQPGVNDLHPRDTSSESCDHTSSGVVSRHAGIGRAGEILVIHNVTRHCGGKYDCVADNGVPPKVKKTIQVKVRFMPEVHLANKRMGQSLGRDTILECTVSGFPQAVTEWQFQGRPLINSLKYKVDIFDHQDELETITINLLIKNITLEDYGVYSCASSNVEGKSSENMVLYQYVQKTRAPLISTTTTTTTSTTVSRHVIARTFKPDYRRISNTKKNYHKGTGPRGRLGPGSRRKNSRDRTDVIETGGRTRPEASIGGGESNSSRLEPSFCLSTIISLALSLLWRR